MYALNISLYMFYFITGTYAVQHKSYEQSWVLCNIGYPSETHLKSKSRKISFVHILFINHPIVSIFCTEHGTDSAVLCEKFQNDWISGMDVMDERNSRDLGLR